MKSLMLCVVVVVVWLIVVDEVESVKLEERWSVKAPFYLRRGSLQMWSFAGSTVVDEDFIRLTSDEKEMKGLMVGKQRSPFENWEVIFEFSVGSDKRQGADGMAFWYTHQKIDLGPVFGASDNFLGLGIFLDTFDNNGKRDNPSLYAVLGDGTKSYDHNDDGGSDIIGKCRVYYRSNPYKTPKHIFAKITNENGKLSVYTDTNGRGSWVKCFGDVNVRLPKGYYFGFSAETGTISDNHDIYSVQITSLDKTNDVEDVNELDEEEDSPQNPIENTRKYGSATSGKNVINENDDLSVIKNVQLEMGKKISSIESELVELESKSNNFEETSKNLLSLKEIEESLTPVVEQLNAIAKDINRLQSTNQKLQSDIRKINDEVEVIINTVKSSSENVKDTIKSHKEELDVIVEKHTSTGYWTYLIFFQVLFAVGFVFYRRNQRSKSKTF